MTVSKKQTKTAAAPMVQSGAAVSQPQPQPAATAAKRVEKKKAKAAGKKPVSNRAKVFKRGAATASLSRRGEPLSKELLDRHSWLLVKPRPGLLRAATRSRGAYDFRSADYMRRITTSFLMKIACRSDKAYGLLRKIVGESPVVVHHDRGLIKLSMIEPDRTSALTAGSPMRSAAHELASTSVEYVEKKEDKKVVRSVELEMIKEEMESNLVAQGLIGSLLQPCSAPCPGYPDEENRALSMKVRVRTVVIAPVANGASFIKISRNPAAHIKLPSGGGAQVFYGPTFKNVSTLGVGNRFTTVADDGQHTVVKLGGNATIPDSSYLELLGTTVIKVSDGISGAGGWNSESKNDPPYLLEPIGELTDDEYDYGIPVVAGWAVSVTCETSDTTVNNYSTVFTFVDAAGVEINSAALLSTGNGSSFLKAYNVPAGAVYFVKCAVTCALAGSTFYKPELNLAFSAPDTPLWVPFGNATGEDIGILLDYADDVRTIGCRATATYIGEKLENGWVVGGQNPLPGDDEENLPTLADLATTIGFKPRALNGDSPGISFPILPMTKETMDYHPLEDLYDDPDFGEGTIMFKATSALSDVVILQTEMSVQARTERQTLETTNGPVDLDAVSKVQTWLASINPLDLVTGNDEHEGTSHEVMREFNKEHPTFNFDFSGWFSGNTLKDIFV
jgi:hypothetical protein